MGSMISYLACILISLAAGIAVAFPLGIQYRKKVAEAELGTAEEEAKRIISDAIKDDIREYFTAHRLELRNESSIQGDYYKLVNGEFEAQLVAKDKDVDLVGIRLSVPTEELAASICDNWQKKNKEIYRYLTEQLF